MDILNNSLGNLAVAKAKSQSAAEQAKSAEEAARKLLVKKAQGGDQRDFERLAQEYLPFISGEIIKLCPRSVLEDVAQEVLLRLYLALPKYQESGYFKWWLKRIVTHACLDYWRSQRRSERISANYKDELSRGPRLGAEIDRDLLSDLNDFMAELSSADRVIFTLALLEDLPHKEVADLLGMTTTAIKVRCFRLKRKARRWFEYEE